MAQHADEWLQWFYCEQLQQSHSHEMDKVEFITHNFWQSTMPSINFHFQFSCVVASISSPAPWSEKESLKINPSHFVLVHSVVVALSRGDNSHVVWVSAVLCSRAWCNSCLILFVELRTSAIRWKLPARQHTIYYKRHALETIRFSFIAFEQQQPVHPTSHTTNNNNNTNNSGEKLIIPPCVLT